MNKLIAVVLFILGASTLTHSFVVSPKSVSLIFFEINIWVYRAVCILLILISIFQFYQKEE